MTRYASRVDANQAVIVDGLRQLGFDVDIVHRQPGLYDIVVSGKNRLMGGDCSVRVEIKTHDGKLNKSEREYHSRQLHPDTLIIARDVEDILNWFGWV